MGAFILRTLIGLVVAALGLSMTWKTPWYLSILGRNPWAERTLGGGGTNLLYKLIGIAIMIIGFIVVTDLFDNLMTWLVGLLF